jgi:hypothetical protein
MQVTVISVISAQVAPLRSRAMSRDYGDVGDPPPPPSIPKSKRLSALIPGVDFALEAHPIS